MKQSDSNTSSPTDIDILCVSANSSEILKGLYQRRKEINRKYSLKFFCREAGIPSTGYLSDVMQGKRVLALKYSKSIVKAFGLKGQEARFLKLTIERDNIESGPKHRALNNKLGLLRKVLRMTSHNLPSNQSGLFYALEVFCAFSLFRNRATLTDLRSFFGADQLPELKAALTTLLSLKLIQTDGEHYIPATSNHVIFSEATTGISHVDFLKQALTNAMENAEYWFPRKQQSYFSSVVLSVNMKHFEKVIGGLKQKMLLTQADLESQDADALIRFNVQVYPLAKPLNP